MPEPVPVAASSSKAFGRRAATTLLAVGWCAALTWLVLATSNPVTLNRRQMLDADAVVTAHVTDVATGTCRIVKQWNGATLPEEVVIRRLADTAVQTDGDWILPLAATADGLEVVPSRLPSGSRLVYPATLETLAQLEEILGVRGDE